MQTETLIREFRYNGARLTDPSPAFSLHQVRDFYGNTYPEIVNAEIEGPEIIGNRNVYTFRRAVGTKGAAVTLEQLRAELVDEWAPEDNTPSCGLAEALERQELFINQAIVTPALGILWEFFRHGRLTWCGAFVNLKTGHVRPLPVPAAEGAQ
ncbi:PRTRC system protein C [Burkholderia multivorans]|uniref:PRTRC system protein C n=1 Tax=Burkholderia multivorans TaxID=87883 RepID=UPI0020B1923E|nr:PRTRC system protein C [Burkholderia multivorans]